MKVIVQVCLLVIGSMAVARADEVISNARAAKLLTKYGCQTCHSMGNATLPGPTYQAIATKYASDPQAIGDLEQSVVNGSSGAWGNNVMPPNSVPDKDLKALVVWILQLTP